MGRSSLTKQYTSTTPTPDRIRVVRRHHPLKGMELEVVRGGKSVLVVRHPDSLTMRIPRDWTDIDGALRAPKTGPDTQLTVETLRDLVHLVDVLLDRD